MAPVSNYFLDTFVAPGLSELTKIDVPDMSAYSSKKWTNELLLNSVFRGSWNTALQPYVYNFVRRAEAAVREYELARLETEKFLAANKRDFSKYAEVMYHWEMFLGQAWHAYELLERGLNAPTELRATAIERAKILYNQMKHADRRIEQGKMPENMTVAAWLTNSGLSSTDTAITYAEAEEILKNIVVLADVLVDPATAHAKISERLGSDDKIEE